MSTVAAIVVSPERMYRHSRAKLSTGLLMRINLADDFQRSPLQAEAIREVEVRRLFLWLEQCKRRNESAKQ